MTESGTATGPDSVLARYGGLAKLRSDLKKRGFVVLENLLAPQQLAALRTDVFEPLLEKARETRLNSGEKGTNWNAHKEQGEFVFENDSDRLLKVQGVVLKDGRVKSDVFENFELLALVRAILWNDEDNVLSSSSVMPMDVGGRAIDIFGTKLFPVWPAGGRSVGWHTDTHYFGVTRESCDWVEDEKAGPILSCAVYLDDADVENGCLQVMPGTHLLKEEPAHEASAEGEWINAENVTKCAKLAAAEPLAEGASCALDVPVAAGSAVLFDARLLHAARKNSSETRTRHSLFAHYVRGKRSFRWRGTDFSFGVYKDRHRVVGD